MRNLVPHEWRQIGLAHAERDERKKRGVDGSADACAPSDVTGNGEVENRELGAWGRKPDLGDRESGIGNRQSESGSSSGMTVVELMVVMAIIAIMMGLGAYSLSSLTNTSLRTDASRVASAMKYTYSNAAINNTEYRLVFNLDNGFYYTEIAKEPVVEQKQPQQGAGGDDFLTEEAQRLADEVEAEKDLFADEEENPFGMNRKVRYERVQDGVLKKTKLSEGARFAKFIKAGVEQEYTEGKVSVTFFPNGFQEQVMIVIRSGEGDDGAAYTLVTEPLTGSVRTYSEEIEIPENFGVVEEAE